MLTKKLKRVAKQWLRPFVKQRFDERKFESLFQSLKGDRDRPLLMHSSLSELGYVPGGPGTIVGSVRKVLSEGSLVAMPSHSWREVARGSRCFDVRRTHSCVGAIAETFRQSKDVFRSLHPTHSLAVHGNGGANLTMGHEFAKTPCGVGTPYHQLLKQDVQILLLAVGLKSHTCYHCAEAVAEVPYLMSPEPHEFELIRTDGSIVQLAFYLHRAKIPRDLTRLETELRDEGLMRTACVGKTVSHLIEGRGFLEFTVDQLRKDPAYLLPGKFDFRCEPMPAEVE